MPGGFRCVRRRNPGGKDPSLSVSLFERNIDANLVGLVRVGMGAAMIMKVVQLAYYVPLEPPDEVLRLPYLDWLPMPPLRVFIALWLVFAGAFALGFKTRWAGMGLCAFTAYWLFLDQQLYLNHLYFLLLMCLLLTVADSGAEISLDARKQQGRGPIPYWPAFLVKAQLSLMYGFAALAKINPDYLSGGVLDRFLHLPFDLQPPDVAAVFLVPGSIGTELFLAVGLWARRTQKFALALGVLFHVAMIFLVGPALQLVVFAVASLVPYLFFTDPARPSVDLRTTARAVMAPTE
jgi:hypothetical protein